jgi:hypothetical protein
LSRPQEIEFAAPRLEVSEASQEITLAINRVNGSLGEITIQLSRTGGTSTPGSDFEERFGPVVLASGAITTSVVIPIAQDVRLEAPETIELALSAPTGAVLGRNGTTTVTIEDGGPPLIAPKNGARVAATEVVLRWRALQAPDDGGVTYQVSYCTDRTFADCSPVALARAATAGSLPSAIALIGIVIGSWTLRRTHGTKLALVVTLALGLSSCGSDSDGRSSGEMSYRVTGLEPGYRYYWKVTATADSLVADSDVWMVQTVADLASAGAPPAP